MARYAVAASLRAAWQVRDSGWYSHELPFHHETASSSRPDRARALSLGLPVLGCCSAPLIGIT